MKKQNLILMITVSAVSLLISITGSANVWRVNNQGTLNHWTNHQVFSTIDSAINSISVNIGDTIYVEASTINYGTVNISQKKVVLIGPGYFLNQNTGLQNNHLDAMITSLTFGPVSSGSKIYGLNLTGGGDVITISNNALSDITISNCYISGTGRIRITNGTSTTLTNINLNQNYITGSIEHNSGGSGNGNISGLFISNNYINGNIIFHSSITGYLKQNVIDGNITIFQGMDFINNIVSLTSAAFPQNTNDSTKVHHNIFAGPAISWLNGNNSYFNAGMNGFTLTNYPPTFDGSLVTPAICTNCINGGYLGDVIGMYGGNTPYKPSGIPAVPTIYYLPPAGNAPIGDTLHVNIKTRSNN